MSAFTRPAQPAVRFDFDVVLAPKVVAARIIPLLATYVNDRARLNAAATTFAELLSTAKKWHPILGQVLRPVAPFNIERPRIAVR
jgi:hypothetical protein